MAKSTKKSHPSKKFESLPPGVSRGIRGSLVGYPNSVSAPVLARVRRLRVPPSDLTWKCSPKIFDFRTTREVPPLRGILGQRQALKTLKMGLSMDGPGYNMFICGLSGVEAAAQIADFIRRLSIPWTPSPDRVCVQSFRDPLRPRILELPTGEGRKFAQGVQDLLLTLREELTNVDERQRRGVARRIIDAELPALRKQFPAATVRQYLNEWRRHLLDHVHEAVVEDYEANCLDGPSGGRMPVVFEQRPTAANLFGWVGRRTLGEAGPAHHFTAIHAGSFLKADGGVLILNAADFQGNTAVWNGVKSCLKYGQLSIEDPDGTASRTGGLHPDAIPVRTKVVMLGDFGLYDHLFEVEPDFRDAFKVRVDFDSEVGLTSKMIKKDYPAFIARTCEECELRPVSAKGVARILEFGVRKAGRKNKITSQTWVLADLLREADYWAEVAGRRTISGPDVNRAVREAVLRLNLVEMKISEMINEGTILIATSGARVGQVNGLAIYDMGDYLFARPSRITAETSVGQSGIINIEREAGFSGRSHDKGVQILAGYLRSRFAQSRPLSLTASVCFEQSYSGIDGDSASATEIYAVLSSLAGLPIRQDIAVTGSMNQKGDIQPIGGVNEKIEGFYDCVCAGRPSGREGVIIPRKNMNELVLREEIVAAVGKGKFHIFAIETIEQGIEVLTGVAAGRRTKNGGHTPGSVFGRADVRLEEIAQGLRRFNAAE